jgi:membrane protein insertase Oxa1/YidC/SpoIIIJ
MTIGLRAPKPEFRCVRSSFSSDGRCAQNARQPSPMATARKGDATMIPTFESESGLAATRQTLAALRETKQRRSGCRATADHVKIVCVVMIILMAGSQFASMHQLMMKNMPASALDNPFAKQQKMMIYLMPLMFVFSGVTFVIGLLLYMLTTNLWTMGQQFYTIRRMPAPGSLAEKALEARRLKSGKEHKKFSLPGLVQDEAEEVPDISAPDTKPASGQRQQPKRKKRVKPTGQGGTNQAGTKPLEQA